MSMSRSLLVVAAAAMLSGCSPSGRGPIGETQPGAAADLSRGPAPGSASSDCRSLPSAADLKKWLQAAPGTGGEAGGLFSGKREWAAIVDRQGRPRRCRRPPKPPTDGVAYRLRFPGHG